MTRNVTLKMDDRLLLKLRHQAVDQHMSLSAWITATLKDIVDDESGSQAKMNALKHLDKGYSLGGRKSDRESLHAR